MLDKTWKLAKLNELFYLWTDQLLFSWISFSSNILNGYIHHIISVVIIIIIFISYSSLLMHWTIFQFVNMRQISMLTKISANNYRTLDFMKIEKLFLLGVAMRRLLEGFFDVSKSIQQGLSLKTKNVPSPNIILCYRLLTDLMRDELNFVPRCDTLTRKHVAETFFYLLFLSSEFAFDVFISTLV